jgi:hypothetical protein
MREFKGQNPYMDYRDSVPFMDLTGFLSCQPKITDNLPSKSLREHLLRKKFSTMINLRRLEYRVRVEEYKNGRL